MTRPNTWRSLFEANMVGKENQLLEDVCTSPTDFWGWGRFSDFRRGMQAKLRGQIKHTLVFTGTVMHCIKTFQARQTTLRH